MKTKSLRQRAIRSLAFLATSLLAASQSGRADFAPVFTRGGEGNSIYAIHPLADGRLVIAGDFEEINGVPRNCLARLRADGTLDPAFDPGPGVEEEDIPSISVIKELPGGLLLIGGYFEGIAGREMPGLVRLLPDGAWDSNFVHHLEADAVNAIEVLSDGKLLVGGRDLSSEVSLGVARLHADGRTDTNFVVSLTLRSTLVATGVCHALAVDAQGRILVGGQFTEVNGTPRIGLARLHPDGSLDASLAPELGRTYPDGDLSAVRSLHVLPDGKILVHGFFHSVDGVPRPGLARLHANGRLDDTFRPWANRPFQYPFISRLLRQPDGSLLVGGTFSEQTGMGSGRAYYLIRLLADGQFESGLTTQPWPSIFALAVRSDQIFVGGRITHSWDDDRPNLSLDALKFSPLLALANPRVTPDHRLELSAQVTPGNQYILERSGDLVLWTALTTNRASESILRFLDPIDPGAQKQFYRIRNLTPQ